ncbi:Fic family protein [Propionibacteriaceae bacterium Y2011]
MTVVREATTRLVEVDELSVDDVIELHAALLPEEPRHHGLRQVQNWIGGSDWHPIDADFVPPAADSVPDLMTDLVRYVNGAAHSPIVQAALAHAQFETIHPFTDGNGRVGRALIHTVLARRGLTPTAVLPVSLVLATLRHEYVSGLTSYRHGAAPGSAAATAGVRDWLEFFTGSVRIAVDESTSLVDQIDALLVEWRERVALARTERGVRQTPRADSAVARLLETLAEAPVLTASSVRRILGVSFPAASAALEELREAEVLTTRRIERNTTAYLAKEILDLVTVTERRLASTRFDTRKSLPTRPVPARPHRPEDGR